MPVQQTKSKLMAKYGARMDQSVKSHAADEADYGFIRLPGGIKNGVAQLTKMYFDEYKSGELKGEFYFRAEGVVIAPETVNTPQGPMKIAGMTTSIMEPVCDTKRNSKDGPTVVTQDEHIKNILNEMRILGADTNGATGAHLETLAQALVQTGPYFKFTTNESAEVKNPDGSVKYQARVWERWHGSKGLEEYDPAVQDNGDGAGGVIDSTPPAPASAANRLPPTHKPAANPAPAKALKPEQEVNENPENIPDVADGEEPDVDALVEAANGGDTAAQAKLSELALAAGHSQDNVDGAADWTAVGALAKGGASAGGEGKDSAPEWKPAKGEMYYYKPIDPKTKKPYVDPKTKKERKAVECEVMAVDEANSTVSLKNVTDGKTIYKGVRWDNLTGEQ